MKVIIDDSKKNTKNLNKIMQNSLKNVLLILFFLLKIF